MNSDFANKKAVDTPSPSKDQDEDRVAAPTISFPKGGGAIRGIGEKFAANPVTGTGSMSVPIATSPGRSGLGPQLSLSYDSGPGMGPLAWAGVFRSHRSRERPIKVSHNIGIRRRARLGCLHSFRHRGPR